MGFALAISNAIAVKITAMLALASSVYKMVDFSFTRNGNTSPTADI